MKYDSIDDKMKQLPYESQVPDSMMTLDILICTHCEKHVPIILLKTTYEGTYLHLNCSCLKEQRVTPLSRYLELIKHLHSTDIKRPAFETVKLPIIASGGFAIKLDKKSIPRSRSINLLPLTSISTSKVSLYYKEYNVSYKMPDRNHSVGYQILISCRTHEEDFTLYCNSCRLNICSKCMETHEGHHIFPIGEGCTLPFDEDMKTINKILHNNKIYTENLIQRIDNLIGDLTMKYTAQMNIYEGMKKEILSFYNHNKVINDELKEFYKALSSTFKYIGNHILYETKRLAETIIINPTEYTGGDQQTLEEYISSLKKHLDSNYIIGQKEKIYECITTMTGGHSGPIKCIIKLNTNHIASGSEDQMIIIWSLTSYQPIAKLIGHLSSITCLLQLNNGYIASGSEDSAIRIWDPQVGLCKITMEDHTESLSSIIQLESGQFASASIDGSIRVWQSQTSCKYNLNYNSPINCLIQLPNEDLVAGFDDTTIKILEYKKLKIKNDLNGHTKSVLCLLSSKDGNLVSGSKDKTIRIWDLNRLICIQVLRSHTDPISCIIQLNNGDYASSSMDRIIKIWNSKTFALKRGLGGHDSNVSCLIQLKNSILVSCSWDHTIKFWILDQPIN